MNGPEPGDVVLSQMGRDNGKLFLVMQVDGDMLSLCDGSSRRMDRMKKKKIRHVLPLGASRSSISEKLRKGDKITNGDVRRALHSFMESKEGITRNGER